MYVVDTACYQFYQFIATLATTKTMPPKRILSSGRLAACAAALSFQVVSGFQFVQHVPSNSPTHVPTWKANSRPSSTTRLHISSPLSAPGIPAIDVSENSPRDVPYMLQWAEACGVQKAEGFELTSDDGGYDVYARTVVDMPAGSPVVIVPEQMILSSNKAAAELRSDDMEQAEKLLASLNAEDEVRQFYLMIKVLLELEKGQDSPWFPWFNSLPRYYTNAASMTPVSVDPDVGRFCFYNISIPSLLLNQWVPSYRYFLDVVQLCYNCLQSLMRKLAMEERAIMNHLTTAVKKCPYLSVDTKGNTELLVFAFQIVYTRAFDAVDGDLRLVPMGDYFNHGTQTEVVMAYDDDGNLFCQTSYDVPAGTPLRMSYGDPTNPSYLFARYGFLDESSPAVFCKMFPPHINKDMLELGYAENRLLFGKDGSISEEVWDLLLYRYLSSTKVGDRRKLMQAHRDGDYATKRALQEQYYPKTMPLLLDHIDTFVSQLDRLTEKGQQRDPREHPRLPLILEHNRIVKETFLRARETLFG